MIKHNLNIKNPDTDQLINLALIQNELIKGPLLEVIRISKELINIINIYLAIVCFTLL